MDEVKERLESLLFASGRKLSTDQLAKLARVREVEVVRSALRQLAEELRLKDGSIMLIEEDDSWRLAVKEKYLPYVRRIVSKTELPKTMLETLAVVAYKAPCLQSEVIKIRTNKGYDHLSELEKSGYVSREKKGRTKLIKLTQKFFDYFDVPPEKLKERLDQAFAKNELVSPDKTSEHLGKLEVFAVPPGQEHEHQLPDSSVDSSVQVPESGKIVDESISPVVQKEELLQPEVQELMKKSEKQDVKGLYPEGVPDDVEKDAEKKVKEMLGKKEETAE